jgi:mitochondrial import receptor subunit TOM40
LMARVDPGRGSVDGRIHRAILGGLAMGKLQVNVSTEGQGDQMLAEMDVGGQSWTGNLKYGSMGGGLVYGCNYFQAITPKLSMGGEGMYISANQNLLSNYTLKYTIPAKTGEEDSPVQAAAKASPGAMSENTGSSTMCLNYNSGQAALSMNYKRVVTPNRVTLGAELQCSPFTLDSQVLLGAEFRLQRSKFAVCIDGTGRMQSTLEAKLGMAPGSPSLNFAAEVDHLKEEMRFGYGMTIDG